MEYAVKCFQFYYAPSTDKYHIISITCTRSAVKRFKIHTYRQTSFSECVLSKHNCGKALLIKERNVLCVTTQDNKMKQQRPNVQIPTANQNEAQKKLQNN